jgi:hypothetical protein
LPTQCTHSKGINRHQIIRDKFFSAIQKEREKFMEVRLEKDKLMIENISADVAQFILKPITEDCLENLEQLGIDPDNRQHKLEISMLSLYAFRRSLDGNKRWTDPVLSQIEQQFKRTYVDIFKYGTSNQIEAALSERTREYDSIFNGQTAMEVKIQSLGTIFASKIESQDTALMYWASRSFIEWKCVYMNFLANLDARFEV